VHLSDLQTRSNGRQSLAQAVIGKQAVVLIDQPEGVELAEKGFGRLARKCPQWLPRVAQQPPKFDPCWCLDAQDGLGVLGSNNLGVPLCLGFTGSDHQPWNRDCCTMGGSTHLGCEPVGQVDINTLGSASLDHAIRQGASPAHLGS
jgi:hypothetical protein